MENHLFCQANNWGNKVAYSLNSLLCFPLAKFRKFKNRWIDLFWTSLKEEAQGRVRQNPWSLRPPGSLEFISWPSHPARGRLPGKILSGVCQACFIWEFALTQRERMILRQVLWFLLHCLWKRVALWCRSPASLAFERPGKKLLEHRVSQGYTERPCLKNTNQTKAME